MRERELYVSSYLSAGECLTIVHLSAYIDDEALQRGEGTYLDGAGDKIDVLSDITDFFLIVTVDGLGASGDDNLGRSIST